MKADRVVRHGMTISPVWFLCNGKRKRTLSSRDTLRVTVWQRRGRWCDTEIPRERNGEGVCGGERPSQRRGQQ